MSEIARTYTAEPEAAERDSDGGRPLTREDFYLQQIDGRTRARKRAILGGVAAACFALALMFPVAGSWLLLVGVFSGLGIGWVE
jgi:hypothetical protein